MPPSTNTLPATDVRPLAGDDIPQLLRLQAKALPDSLAARFGDGFAELYYRALLAEKEFFCDGFFWEGTLVAFIAYASDVHAVLGGALRRNVAAFGMSLARASLSSPRRMRWAMGIAGSIIAGADEPGQEVRAELISIGLLPEFRGTGARRQQDAINPSRQLTRGACDVLYQRGVRRVKVFCKPEEIEPIANGFVKKEGFVLHGRVRRYGLPTNLYVKELGDTRD